MDRFAGRGVVMFSFVLAFVGGVGGVRVSSVTYGENRRMRTMLNIRIHINHTYSYPPEGGKSTGRQPPDECRASTASNSEREPRSTSNAAPKE